MNTKEKEEMELKIEHFDKLNRSLTRANSERDSLLEIYDNLSEYDSFLLEAKIGNTKITVVDLKETSNIKGMLESINNIYLAKIKSVDQQIKAL